MEKISKEYKFKVKNVSYIDEADRLIEKASKEGWILGTKEIELIEDTLETYWVMTIKFIK